MILFEGVLSGSAKKYHTKSALINSAKILMLSVLLIIPFMYFMMLFISQVIPANSYLFKIFELVPVFILLIIAVYMFKVYIESAPQKIIINTESVTSFTKKAPIAKYIYEVIAVHDFGEFYQLKFKTGSINLYFVCQKSLLKEGDLKEFEEIFKGIIVKK